MNNWLIIENSIDINTLNNCLFHVCFENIRFEQSSCSNILLAIRVIRNNIFYNIFKNKYIAIIFKINFYKFVNKFFFD